MKRVKAAAVALGLIGAVAAAVSVYGASQDGPGIRLRGGKAYVPPDVTVIVLYRYHPKSVLLSTRSKAGMSVSVANRVFQSKSCAVSVEGDYLGVRCGENEIRKQKAMSVQDVSGPLTISIKGAVSRRYRGMLSIEADNSELRVINTVPLEDYLAGVVGEEMESKWAEAMKAQAVVARTYALANRSAHGAYDFCDLTHCQEYKGYDGESDRSREAVKQTRALVAMYKGRLIDAWYHSACGGHTSPPDPVWGAHALSDAPYLAGVDDGKNCAASPNYRWATTFTPAQIRELETENLEGAILDIKVTGTTDIGQVTKLEIKTSTGTKVVSGYEFYRMVGQTLGWNLVKSTRFTVAKKSGVLVVSGRGLGHGIGLCQWGAAGQAKDGKKFQDIIRFYFPGAEVKAWDGELPPQRR